jgi:hypothetical protein
MIMQFDPSNAEMAKFGDNYADSEFNGAEALCRAKTHRIACDLPLV